MEYCRVYKKGKNKSGVKTPDLFLPFVQLLSLEHILAEAADGAGPGLGDLFPGGAGGNTVVGISDGGVVDVTAGADVLH